MALFPTEQAKRLQNRLDAAVNRRNWDLASPAHAYGPGYGYWGGYFLGYYRDFAPVGTYDGYIPVTHTKYTTYNDRRFTWVIAIALPFIPRTTAVPGGATIGIIGK